MSKINNEADKEKVQDWLDKFGQDKVLNAHIYIPKPSSLFIILWKP
jgi:hypothetical protein